MGGTLASVVNIIAISMTDNPLDMGFGYFLTAVIIIIIALLGYLILPLMVCTATNVLRLIFLVMRKVLALKTINYLLLL